MSGGDGAPGLLGDRGVDPRRRLRRVGLLRQRLELAFAEQRLALDVGADDDRARRRRQRGRERTRQHRLAGAGQSTDRDHDRRRRGDEAARPVEIGAGDARDLRSLIRLGVRQPRRGHLGADRGAHRQEERQRRERVEVLVAPGFDQIAVERDVRGRREIALDQVHQQEGEIVEHVAGRDDLAELDRVEQHRAVVEQNDVAEVQVAVDAADEVRFVRARRAARGCARRRRGRRPRTPGSPRAGTGRAAGRRLRHARRCSFRARRSSARRRRAPRRRAMPRRCGRARRPAPRRFCPWRRDGRACRFSSKRRISTAHSTGSPRPSSASRPSGSRVMATTRR